MIYTCKIHGETKHYTYNNYHRCKKCNVIAVARRRKELKLKAIQYMGNKCKDCGIVDICPAIYDFHHLNSEEKDFNISRKGYTFSWNKVKSELDKCILLCANCHRKRHFKEEEFPKKLHNDIPNLCKCGKQIERRSKNCTNCRATKIKWPPINILKKELEVKSYMQLGKELGISDSAIRKRLKTHSK